MLLGGEGHVVGRGGACCWEGRGMLLGGEGHVVGRGGACCWEGRACCWEGRGMLLGGEGHVVGRGGFFGRGGTHLEGRDTFRGEGHV